MTITPHGFAMSNYYNKVKMALLEKGVAFEEVHDAPQKPSEGIGMAFFGVPALPPESSARIRKQIEGMIEGFKRLARFSPYVAGDTFTQADLSAFNNLPLVGLVTKTVYGEDLLLAAGVDYKAYVKRVGERASAQKVVADRKLAQMPKA